MDKISCGFSYQDRQTLLDQRDLSPSARAALEFQGGELSDHFEAELSEDAARELRAKCEQFGLRIAADNLAAELKGVESRRWRQQRWRNAL